MRIFFRSTLQAFGLAAIVVAVAAEPALAASGADFLRANMAPIMFVALVAFLLLGYPVAFALAANGLMFAVVGIQLGLFQENFLAALPERIYGTMNNDVLLAIPFFTFMGLVLERSGMAEDLLDTIGQLFGPVRGGLAYAVVFVGALLAATTGVVAASVIAMGLISLPIMLRYGYDRRVASGVIAASGTLAQIIPPSLVLIVMADQLGRSVGDMYEGAFIPGLVLSLLYAAFIFLLTIIRPDYVPGLPPEAQRIKEDPAAIGRVRVVTNIGMLVAAPALFWILLTAINMVLGWIGAPLFASGVGLAGLFKGQMDAKWLAAIVGGLGYAAWRIATSKEESTIARLNLLVLTTIAGVMAVLYMTQRTNVRAGADFVVLSMSLGVTIAFTLALANRFLNLGFLSKIAEEVTFVMVPPLALIFLVLGTIFIGLATPTEGGAMGATGAIILAGLKRYMSNEPRRLNWDVIRSATESTAKLSAFVLFILVGARVFSLTFYGVNGHVWVEHLLTSLPGGQVGFLIVVNALIFVLAFFLDFFELAFIAVPLIGPAADKLGIDLIWFGVILGVNMQTSFMHPPFGFALFYLRSVAPKEAYKDRVTNKVMQPITTGQIYWGAVPFVIIQCIMVALVIFFPQMVMHYKASNVQLDQKSIDEQLKNLAPPSGDLPGIGVPQIDVTQPPKI